MDGQAAPPEINEAILVLRVRFRVAFVAYWDTNGDGRALPYHLGDGWPDEWYDSYDEAVLAGNEGLIRWDERRPTAGANLLFQIHKLYTR